MKKYILAGCMVLLCGTSACVKNTAIKVNPTAPVPIEIPNYYPTTVEVREAIFSAAHSLRWRVQDRAPGTAMLIFTMDGRESITFNVEYTSREYAIQYRGSSQKAYSLESGKVHPYFETLALELRSAIDAKLAKTPEPAPRIRVTPAVSLDFNNSVTLDPKEREAVWDRLEKEKEEDEARRLRIARFIAEERKSEKASVLIGSHAPVKDGKSNTDKKEENIADKQTQNSGAAQHAENVSPSNPEATDMGNTMKTAGKAVAGIVAGTPPTPSSPALDSPDSSAALEQQLEQQPVTQASADHIPANQQPLAPQSDDATRELATEQAFNQSNEHLAKHPEAIPQTAAPVAPVEQHSATQEPLTPNLAEQQPPLPVEQDGQTAQGMDQNSQELRRQYEEALKEPVHTQQNPATYNPAKYEAPGHNPAILSPEEQKLMEQYATPANAERPTNPPRSTPRTKAREVPQAPEVTNPEDKQVAPPVSPVEKVSVPPASEHTSQEQGAIKEPLLSNDPQ